MVLFWSSSLARKEHNVSVTTLQDTCDPGKWREGHDRLATPATDMVTDDVENS